MAVIHFCSHPQATWGNFKIPWQLDATTTKMSWESWKFFWGNCVLSPHCHFQRNTNQNNTELSYLQISLFQLGKQNEIQSWVKYVTKLESRHLNTNIHICVQSSLTGFPTDVYIQVSVLETIAPCPNLKNTLLGICPPPDLDGAFFQASILRITA